MRVGQFLALATMMMLARAAGAAWISLGDAPTGVTLLEERDGIIRLRCEVGGLDAEPVQVGGATWHRLRLPEGAVTLQAGAPELPLLAASVVIPDQGAMVLRVVAEEHVDLPLRPLPSKGNLTRDVDPATVPLRFGPEYQLPVWPEESAFLREPYILRDHRGQAVVFQPVQALPQAGMVRVFTRLEVELATTAEPGVNELFRAATPASSATFAGIYAERFLNLPAERYVPVEEEGRLLIICHDDFLDEMAPFVEWKRQKGQDVVMLAKSEVGTTSTAIRNFVTIYYSDPGLAFLLLVGDAEQMPSPSHSGGLSDPTYAMVVGTDSYPDILVGRFSASTGAQVVTMVERCVEYERDPEVGAVWYEQAVGVASNEGAGIGDDGESDRQHLDNIRTDLLGYGYDLVDRVYDPGATAATLSAALNAGRSLINYVGHGSVTSWATTGFSNTHVNNLTNHNRLPFIFDVACVNGQFNGTTCFAEAWMRATDAGEPTGAVGIYASTINQSWAPPMSAQDEMADLLVAESKLSFGGLCYNGAMRMNDEYADYAMTRTWTVFTDPSLQVRTRTPQELDMVGEPAWNPDGRGLAVTTNRPGARAALWTNGATLATAVADEAGLASLAWESPLAPGDSLLLTVTAHNATTVRRHVVMASALAAPVAQIHTTANGQILLSWSEVPGATAYQVWERDTLLPEWRPLLMSGARELSLTLEPGRSRFFQVTALREVPAPVQAGLPANR